MKNIATKVKKQLKIKELLHEALDKLAVPRKGVSFYAVKKYIVANHPDLDLEPNLFHLKKALRTGIEKQGETHLIS